MGGDHGNDDIGCAVGGLVKMPGSQCSTQRRSQWGASGGAGGVVVVTVVPQHACRSDPMVGCDAVEERRRHIGRMRITTCRCGGQVRSDGVPGDGDDGLDDGVLGIEVEVDRPLGQIGGVHQVLDTELPVRGDQAGCAVEHSGASA